MSIWFYVGIIFLAIELLTFGVVSIWFALGAFLTIFFKNLSLEYQFYIFVVCSLISLVLFRQISLKYLKGNSKELNRIDEKIVKIENIDIRGNFIIYTVYLDGKLWEAISDERFNLGDKAKVKSITGNKLVLIK